MALLRNREVQILGKTDGEDFAPTYTVLYKDGERENVRLTELHITEDEKKELLKANGENVLVNVKVVDDKKLQEVRDNQDRTKIEDKQSKVDTTKPVEVKKVFVDSAEVAEKTPAKKVK